MALVARMDRWLCDPIELRADVKPKTVRGRLAVWGKDDGWIVDDGSDGIMALHRPATVGRNPSHLSLCFDELEKGTRVRGTLITWRFGAGQDRVHHDRLAAVARAVQTRH